MDEPESDARAKLARNGADPSRGAECRGSAQGGARMRRLGTLREFRRSWMRLEIRWIVVGARKLSSVSCRRRTPEEHYVAAACGGAKRKELPLA